jgi:hypothetical protein
MIFCSVLVGRMLHEQHLAYNSERRRHVFQKETKVFRENLNLFMSFGMIIIAQEVEAKKKTAFCIYLKFILVANGTKRDSNNKNNNNLNNF